MLGGVSPTFRSSRWARLWKRADLALLLGAIIALFAGAGVAEAHAELTRSDPAADSILATAPTRLTLWYSEEPELLFSEIRVVDRTNRQVDRGDLRPDPNDRLGLTVGLRDVAPGTYTVTWKVLSAVDGHVTRGVFVFTVGLDQTPTGAVVGSETAGSTATPDRVLIRVIGYIGLLLALGAFPFAHWILLPALAHEGAARDTVALATRRTLQTTSVGIALALLAAFASLVAQTAAAFDVPVAQAIGERLLALALGTRYGLLWWTQLVLLLAIGVVVVLLRRGTMGSVPLQVGMLLGATLLLFRSLGTHAAAVPDATPAAVALDWIHVVAVIAWIGGLAHMSLALWTLSRSTQRAEALRVAARLVPRFSLLGAICVGSLVVTGVYQSWLHVGSVGALIGTPYGQALLVKLGLIVPLLLLGATNLLVLRPRLQAMGARDGAEGDLVRRLRLTVGGEIVFALAVFVAVGVMASIQPARDAFAAQGIERSVRAEDLQVSVRAQPGLAAINRFDVYVTDRQGRPVIDADRVALRFNMLAMDMGESELVASGRGDGHYVAQGGNLAMAGPWRVEVIVRRSGRDDVRAPVIVDIAAAPVGNASAARPAVGEANLVLGIELLVLALGAFGLAVWAFLRRPRALRWAAPLAVVTLIAGGALTVQGAMALSVNNVRNPIPPTPASIARGAAIYGEDCAICHGESGRGDGPAGLALNPRPADFRAHLAAGHTDGQLFDWITNGFRGTAMPPFKDQLSEEDRWSVLNYIQQTFGPGSPAPASTPPAR